ncbi:hypothetical protein H311_01181, partial [Anncaliia algerae PRA109]
MLKHIINLFKVKKEEIPFNHKDMPFYSESNWNYLEDFMNRESNYQHCEYISDLIIALKKSIQPIKHRLTTLLRLNNPEVFNTLTNEELEIFYDEMSEFKKKNRMLRYKGLHIHLENDFEERFLFDSKPFGSGRLEIDKFYFTYYQEFINKLNEKIDKNTKICQKYVHKNELRDKSQDLLALNDKINKHRGSKRELNAVNNDVKRVRRLKAFLTPIKDDASLYFLQKRISPEEYYKLENPYYNCMEGENKMIKGRVPLEMMYFYDKYVKKPDVSLISNVEKIPLALSQENEERIEFDRRESYMYDLVEETESVSNKNILRNVINYYKNKFNKSEVENIVKNIEVIENKKDLEQFNDSKEEIKSANISTKEKIVDESEKTDDLPKSSDNLFKTDKKEDILDKTEEPDAIKITGKIKSSDIFGKEDICTDEAIDRSDKTKPIDLFGNKYAHKLIDQPINMFQNEKNSLENISSVNKPSDSSDQIKPVDLFKSCKTDNTTNIQPNIFDTSFSTKKESFDSSNILNLSGKDKPVDLFGNIFGNKSTSDKNNIGSSNIFNNLESNKPTNISNNLNDLFKNTANKPITNNSVEPINLFKTNDQINTNLNNIFQKDKKPEQPINDLFKGINDPKSLFTEDKDIIQNQQSTIFGAKNIINQNNVFQLNNPLQSHKVDDSS